MGDDRAFISKRIPFTLPADHHQRMAAARRWAQWELGNPGWADYIMEAYMDPDYAHEALDAYGADE
jgi:hypothetical protein